MELVALTQRVEAPTRKQTRWNDMYRVIYQDVLQLP